MKTTFYHMHIDHPKATKFTRAGITQAYADAMARRQVRGHALADHVPSLRGVTVCVVYSEDGVTELRRGFAFCSWNDQFCRRTGRLIAQGRARAPVALHETTGDCCPVRLPMMMERAAR